jgi:hypothetical protein
MLAPESILAWIIIGAIAGWLAGVLVKGYGFGVIGNIVIGILGAGIAGLPLVSTRNRSWETSSPPPWELDIAPDCRPSSPSVKPN